MRNVMHEIAKENRMIKKTLALANYFKCLTLQDIALESVELYQLNNSAESMEELYKKRFALIGGEETIARLLSDIKEGIIDPYSKTIGDFISDFRSYTYLLTRSNSYPFSKELLQSIETFEIMARDLEEIEENSAIMELVALLPEEAKKEIANAVENRKKYTL